MTARLVRGRLRLLGTGASLPGPPLATHELLMRIERNFRVATDVRIAAALARKLGVRTRHHSRNWKEAGEGPRVDHRNPVLAASALTQALSAAGVCVESLQYLIGHTTTPARLLPPNVAEVATRLGCKAPYAELRQACTGFASAVQWAAAMLASPGAAAVAIVGSEVGSVFFDPVAVQDDPAQWVNLLQMGDGAGAVVVGPDDGQTGPRIESMFFGHIGLGRTPAFTLDEGGSDYPRVRPGRSVATFAHDFEAVKAHGAAVFRAGLAAARECGVDIGALAAILPHQVNGKIGRWLAQSFGLPGQLFYGNGEHVGNLGSAAMWVALHDLRHSGRLHPGDRVLVLGAEATQFLYGGFVYVHA